jgi:hypothetical protein
MSVLETISMIGIVVNAAICFWTSERLYDWEFFEGYKDNDYILLCAIVGIEHGVIGLKILLQSVIKDRPAWVIDAEHQDQANVEYLNLFMDEKLEDFKATGGVTLDDQIKKMKAYAKDAAVEARID